jgi:hypothetical protein
MRIRELCTKTESDIKIFKENLHLYAGFFLNLLPLNPPDGDFYCNYSHSYAGLGGGFRNSYF